MAEPKNAPRNDAPKVDAAARPDPTPSTELATAHARIAELERELDASRRAHQGELDAASSVLQSAHRELDEARARIAQLERLLDDATRAPGNPAARGRVVTLRALRGLRFTLRGTPTRLAAGRTVETTPEDLTDDGLVEGEDFEVIAR